MNGTEPNAYGLAADAVLLLHAAVVVFVVAGLAAIALGGWRGWRWVTDPWFRLLHLGAIGVVAAQAWAGVLCPLTVLENALRVRAGGGAYEMSFVAHWVHRLLYYEAPWWVFTVAYSVFGLAVVVAWCVVRPRPFGTRAQASRSRQARGDGAGRAR
ncbi:MAG: DUF2784 domain-containing protein [Gammaproteobacteria bacterium]